MAKNNDAACCVLKFQISIFLKSMEEKNNKETGQKDRENKRTGRRQSMRERKEQIPTTKLWQKVMRMKL